QGIFALSEGDKLKAAGYFGEATLRLLGMSKDAVAALKTAPSKPPLPRAEADVRGVPRYNPAIPNHVAGAKGEEELARTVHSLPDEVVVRWGGPVTANGPDVISVNQRTG